MIRQPIVSVLGHVDAGKTTLLDHIRGSVVAEQEAGGITQMIGATAVPLPKIADICGDLLQQLDTDLEIPGLLFIDTPGHAAFTTLRERGGSLSDIAVVVIDINSGVQPQTREAIDILKESGTPFVIALNKVDTVPGWQGEDDCAIRSYHAQADRVQQRLDDEIYELMGAFSDMDIVIDRYDRVDDFQEKVAVVPMAAATGEGVPDLLMVLSGLAQRYLTDRLEVHTDGPGKGTVLEVNDVKGFGTTIDVILYDGMIQKTDTLVVGGRDGPITTDIKAVLEPERLQDIRTEHQFQQIDTVAAAAGVKIAAPGMDAVVAGAPVRFVHDSDSSDAAADVEAEMAVFAMETADHGVIVRADSLGSLEAVMDVVREHDIPVRTAAVGQVSKKDVIEAGNETGTNRAIIAFNTPLTDAAAEAADDMDIHFFQSDIIYELVEQYEDWVERVEADQQEQVLQQMTRPAHIRLLPDHTFRSSDPAVVGIEVLNGVLNSGSSMMTPDGDAVGRVKAVQDEGESIQSAEKGDEVAISITNVTIGRQVDEGDDLYTDITGNDYRRFQELEDAFTAGERQVMEKITAIKDSRDPRWKLE